MNYFLDDEDDENQPATPSASPQLTIQPVELDTSAESLPKVELPTLNNSSNASESAKKKSSFDPTRSVKQNLLDFSKKKQDLEVDNERIKKQQKALAIGDFFGLIGKGIGAWGGVTPTYNPTYFSKLEEQRTKNTQMYDALDLQERNLRLSDYYRQEDKADAQTKADAERKNNLVIQKLKDESAKRESASDLALAQYQNQFDLDRDALKYSFQADQDAKNRNVDYYRIDSANETKNKDRELKESTKNSSGLTFTNTLDGEAVTVPQAFYQSAVNDLAGNSGFIESLFTDGTFMGNNIAKQKFDAEVCKMYQDFLNQQASNTSQPTPSANSISDWDNAFNNSSSGVDSTNYRILENLPD